MKNITKISSHQLFALVANFTVGTTIIAASSGVAGLSKQDAWISALITPVVGLPFVWMYYYLGKLYPGKTLVEMICSAFGKWVGWIISAAFVLFVCFLDASQVITYIGDFVKTEYMTETPLYALNLLMVIGLAIGLLYGLEAISRSAEIFIYIATVIVVLSVLLNLPNIKFDNLLPVLENGITPVLKGTLNLSSYMTWPLIVINMVYPANCDNTNKSRNSLFFGYVFGAGVNFICTIMSILVLGSTITARSQYPTYLLAKEIDISSITRIEGVVALAWILTEFVKTLLYFYAGAVGISQLLKLKDYKKVVLPLSLILLVFSGVVYPDFAYQTKWDSTTWIPFIGSFGAFLPILLIIVSIININSKYIKNLENEAP